MTKMRPQAHWQPKSHKGDWVDDLNELLVRLIGEPLHNSRDITEKDVRRILDALQTALDRRGAADGSIFENKP